MKWQLTYHHVWLFIGILVTEGTLLGAIEALQEEEHLQGLWSTNT